MGSHEFGVNPEPERTHDVRYVWSEPTSQEVTRGRLFFEDLGEDVETIDVLVGDGDLEDVKAAYEIISDVKNGLRDMPPTSESYDFYQEAIPQVALAQRTVVLDSQLAFQEIKYPVIFFLGKRNDALYRLGRNMLINIANVMLAQNNQSTITAHPSQRA